MTASEMRAGAGTLSRAAGLVAVAKGDFDSLSGRLSGTITGYQARWQGEGGRAFFRLHEAWIDKQNRVVRALNEFEAALLATERDTTRTDQQQAEHLASSHRRLDGVTA